VVAPHDTVEQRLQKAWLSRGPLAIALLPAAWLYILLTALRRALYRVGVLSALRLDVPVVVVGNLIVGGAGKTPTTLALLALLRRQGWSPGVVSRGHGRASQDIVDVGLDTPVQQCGDEPLLLRLRGAAPVCVGADRVAAARELRQRHPEVDIIVCDDGLQHLRLARDVQIIVFDERGTGNGWRLPAGPLRDPMPRRLPPRSLVLYNASVPSTALPGHVARRSLAGAVSLAGWWLGDTPGRDVLASLRGRPVLAAAGLAHPARFFRMLREKGLEIVEHPLPDHHGYDELAWPDGFADVIVTEKDAVKLRPAPSGTVRVWVAALDFGFPEAFEQELLALLPQRSNRTD
jgi:tetraacyldisaccharide 4'-kinase